MSISIQELNPKGVPLTSEMQANLSALFGKINRIRDAWGKPMVVTSGVRSVEDQKRIYREMAGVGAAVVRIPMGSQHLKAAACDISDSDGALKAWCLNNVPFLEECGLWCEDFGSTPTWVHFQIVPPASGKRFFKP